MQNRTPTEELIVLLDDLQQGKDVANAMQNAMKLVSENPLVEVKSRSNEEPGHTLLHFLVLNNANGVNDKEIAELLDAHENLANVKNGIDQTPLQVLVTQYEDIHVSFGNLKRTAMQLARKGADLTVKSRWTENTLLHYLALNNADGKNDQEMAELLKRNYKIAQIRNKRNISP